MRYKHIIEKIEAYIVKNPATYSFDFDSKNNVKYFIYFNNHCKKYEAVQTYSDHFLSPPVSHCQVEGLLAILNKEI